MRKNTELMRRLRRLHESEKGGGFVLLAIIALLMFIISFGYMIDLSFTHSATTAAQTAFDEAARQGLAVSPDWQAMRQVADQAAHALLDNSQFDGPYFSNGIGDPGAEYKLWVPSIGTNNTSFFPSNDPPPTVLYTNILSLAVDPLVGGLPWDTWGNAVVLRANLTPFQTFRFGTLLPQTKTEVITVGHQQSRLIYVIVDPTMSGLDAATSLWGDFAFVSPTVPEQLPVIGATTPPGVPLDGSWDFPAPRTDVPMSWYSPRGTLDIATVPPGEEPPGFPNALTLASAVYRSYATACDNAVFRIWKDAVVRFIDLLTETSSYDYFAMVALAGTVPDIERGGPGTFDEAQRAPWDVAGGHDNPVANPNGSFDHELDWYRTIPIHPFITNIQGVHAHFDPGVTLGAPLPWLGAPLDSVGNDGALHDTKTEAFRGYINTGTPDVHAGATLLGNITSQPMGGGGTGGMGFRASWNSWMELCACSGLYANSNSGCNGGQGYCLSDEHYGKVGVHDDVLLHVDEDKRYRRAATPDSWCAEAASPVDAVSLTDHRNLSNHQHLKTGETVRNIIAGLGMGVINANLPTDRMLQYDSTGTNSAKCFDVDPEDPSANPDERCWKKPADDQATATQLPAGCINGNTDAEGCDFNGGAGWNGPNDWIPDTAPNLSDPRRWDRRLWWAPRYTMLSHSIRHGVDMLSLYSNAYEVNNTPYYAVNPIPPENKVVVAFAFRPYDPFIVSTDAGLGISRAAMKQDFRKTLAYALCTNETEVMVFGLAIDDHARNRWTDFSDVVEEFRAYYTEQSNPVGAGDLDSTIGSGGLAPLDACTQTSMGNASGNTSGKMARVTLDVFDPGSATFSGTLATRQALAAQAYRDSVPSTAYELLTKYDLQL